MFSSTELNVDLVADCLPDWPKGPLDEWRSRATFDWKMMKLVLEGDYVIRYKNQIWSMLRSDPVFHQNPWDEYSRDEERQLTFARLKHLVDYKLSSEDEDLSQPFRIPTFVQAIGQFSWSLIVKRTLSYEYFVLACKSDKSGRNSELIVDVMNFKGLGALSITELAHGSNTKALKTSATFDPKDQCFIFNTPNLEATKVWSGVLGQSATHAVVFAQLYTEDGVCHGLHSFLVPVRDSTTFETFPGIVIGDMGAKVGLNGLDNGFMTFNNYRVPKSALLSRSSDVTAEGKYISQVKDKSERIGSTLGVLSSGRLFIIQFGVTNMQSALTIAIRYSAIRRQFGPANGEEIPIIDYQSQQWRLIPYLAVSFVFHNFFGSFYRDFVQFYLAKMVRVPGTDISAMGAEIHSLSSVGKAMVTWIAMDTIQECRECCGGYGYLKAARFGDLRNDHDANVTYEGDNNVLLQQTSNYLIKYYKEKVETGKPIRSPFGSVNFIDSIDAIMDKKSNNNQLNDITGVLNAYQFLVCYLLRLSYSKLLRKTEQLGDQFAAKNATQVYYLRSLSIVFFELEALNRYQSFLINFNHAPKEIIKVLKQLGLLYGLWSIEKHLSILYESGYLSLPKSQSTGSELITGTPTIIKELILQLCYDLKDNSVALVDSFSPPDHILNSSLGLSDGKIYDNIFSALKNAKGAFDRPEWLEELTVNVKPKL
ncbi:peroxisomal acyl-coenzyme A oxidase 3-like [Panonychus citri]|uniref:peroxisomal acyl-coenzyme A oxidase 3-like n=2 Tax=Panonychus citri TaxID=50023 RepID=UPI0023074332|nr:peroxisomal acyl-coenzyme A oxidase 3-like [Panonychus citri]